MATSSGSGGEQPSTYFVQDRSNRDELARLQIQDQMLTRGMGGVLPEQASTVSFERVLDVACGTGGWLVEMAKAYPQTRELVGVDVSEKMLGYARKQVEAQGLNERITFRMMDALRTLEFPDGHFDLVNQRLGWSYLRKWEWPHVITEMRRVARPGGTIRMTEGGWMTGNSEALMKLHDLALEASYNSAHLFLRGDNASVINDLPRLLKQYGVKEVHTHIHHLTFPAGTAEGDDFRDDIEHLFQVSIPFFQKWAQLPNDYTKIYQQMLKDAGQPGFVGEWTMVTAWGNVNV
jgi:ubiquinone/menaquinone biosynthesis C-methylase UbiE